MNWNAILSSYVHNKTWYSEFTNDRMHHVIPFSIFDDMIIIRLIIRKPSLTGQSCFSIEASRICRKNQM